MSRPPGHQAPRSQPPIRRSDRFDRYQREHSWIGFPIAVAYKIFDDRAPYLAALVTYYSFVSLFPLILLFLSVIGFVLHRDPHLQQEVVGSALGNLPGLGSQLKRNITGFKGSTGGIIVGLVGVIYGALGATQAAQAAFNQIYAVPRSSQLNPIRSRIRSLGLLSILGTGVLVSSGIALLVSTGNDLSSQLGTDLKIVGYGLSFVINFGLFTGGFQLLTATELKARDVMVGGAIAAGVWELLQAFGARYVVHELNHGNALYGVFGVVLATLAWLYLEALSLMVSAEINVILQRHLWPRSLLTPFTDNVVLTPADEVAYRSYAQAQRFKGFERVDAEFEPPACDPERSVDSAPGAGSESGEPPSSAGGGNE